MRKKRVQKIVYEARISLTNVAWNVASGLSQEKWEEAEETWERTFNVMRMSQYGDVAGSHYEDYIDQARDDCLRLVNVVKRNLQEKLPAELREIYDLDIEVEIKAVHYGSLSVFFAVALGAYGLLAQYKDVNESIELIRLHASGLLEKLLPTVSKVLKVVVEYRHGRRPSRLGLVETFRGRRSQGGTPIEAMEEALEDYEASEYFSAGKRHGTRDAFFYFLLTICILESAAIVILVAKAVAKIYFQ